MRIYAISDLYRSMADRGSDTEHWLQMRAANPTSFAIEFFRESVKAI